jgi:hypothetical protein
MGLGVGYDKQEVLMVKVGDSVEVATRKIGQTPRTGTVTAVRGALITVRWDAGDETSLIPAAGSLGLVGAAGAADSERSSLKPVARGTPATKTASGKSTAKNPARKKKTAKGPAAEKAVKRH